MRLFLHGYFFVTSGRDAILGHDKDTPDDVSAAWNARVARGHPTATAARTAPDLYPETRR